ncbi:porin family protein [Photobacterium sanguinicancri]|uniref:Porin family protein n=1 Tax=Photobacterium sanguinicancri TaxID=875932 RepID=A0AAW7Y5F8_9GAMM|nr:porin family protein [Photobacterium sanguinicancri]KXI24490.1 hypothetical protein AS132_00450 [Photobacterium sanguinicancri]MDO6541969.1 porin family protein [Photobacterium sanguinicancri]
MKLMKNVKLPAILKLSLIISLITPTLANATGFYIGANVGAGQQKNSTMVKNEEAPIGALKAGYDINEYFGVEMRYGGVNLRTDEISLRDFTSVYAKAQYPINQHVSVYGLVGATSAKIDEATHKSTKNSGSFGAGVSYSITDSLKANVELNRVSSHERYKLDAVTLGLDYKF